MDSRKMGDTMVFRGEEYKVLLLSGKNSFSIDLNLNRVLVVIQCLP
jgi:hypothetical protein